MCLFLGCVMPHTWLVTPQVLNHDDALEAPDLASGFSDTKAAFEAQWDMLYNPPLTQKVMGQQGQAGLQQCHLRLSLLSVQL
jgi:hypothetical protein